MLEKRWSYEGGTAVDTRDSDTTRLDVRELVRKAGGRRPGGRGVELSERDVICATALAAHQSSAQAPSVLDVDATSLRLTRVKVPRESPAEPQWTPPVLLPVDEPLALEASTSAAAAKADLRDQLRRDRRGPRRRALAGALALGLTGLLAGGLFFTLTERGDAGLVADAAPVVAAAAVPDPALLPADGLEGPAAPAAEEAVLAHVEGVLDITGATFREDLAGTPGEPATSFAAGKTIAMQLDFEYVERDAGDALGVAWFRDTSELERSEFGLTAGPQSTSVPGPVLDQPGAYRAEVLLNDEVLTTVPFDVTAP